MGHDLVDQTGRIAAEVYGAVVAVGSLFLQGMPAIATFLAIIWYLINILNSRQGKAFVSKIRRKVKDNEIS